jgi:predicted ATP-binding protein involved in virulence
LQAGLKQKRSTGSEWVAFDDFHQKALYYDPTADKNHGPMMISGIELNTKFNLASSYGVIPGGNQNINILELLTFMSNDELQNSLMDNPQNPVLAHYGTFRESNEVKRGTSTSWRVITPGYSASHGREGWRDILDARTVYADVNNWFNEAEAFELRHQREVGLEYRDKSLACVRRAVDAMIENVSNLRMTGSPPRLMVDFQLPSGRTEPLYLDQLSGGYKLILSLVIDLARRMAMINPKLEDPLKSEGIVMIDEIDLHLHPKWQQRIVHQLRRTFPNIQFILTTHSPQVLTALKPENIRKISWRGDDIHFDEIPSTYGAESGRVLAEVMEVEERPPEDDVEFVGILKKYRELVAAGAWDSDEANEVLSELHRLSPDDPVLVSLALERRRLAARKSGQS